MLGSRGKRAVVEHQMVRLQQQTLSAVNALVNIQKAKLELKQQLYEVKKAKLELKREKVAMKKAKMAKEGMVQAEDGSWVIVLPSVEE